MIYFGNLEETYMYDFHDCNNGLNAQDGQMCVCTHRVYVHACTHTHIQLTRLS